MKIENLKHWLSLAANLGVIVGIVFLSIEISQSNRIALGTAESDMRINAMEYTRSISQNDEVASILTKLAQPESELTALEAMKAQASILEFVNLIRSAESLFRNGLITTETYNGYLSELTLFMDNILGSIPIFVEISSSRIDGRYAGVFDHILQVAEARGYIVHE